MSTEQNAITPQVEQKEESSTLRVVGWFAVGIAVTALGIVVGRELRNRYKFNRRTPYDFYSNAREEANDEFVGV